jgi:hypothetical protein
VNWGDYPIGKFALRSKRQQRAQHLVDLKQTRIAVLGIVCGVVNAKKIKPAK